VPHRKGNALDQSMLDAIAATLIDLSSGEGDARCVIITSADEMFSAGYEISDGTFMDEAEPQKDSSRYSSTPRKTHSSCSSTLAE